MPGKKKSPANKPKQVKPAGKGKPAKVKQPAIKQQAAATPKRYEELNFVDTTKPAWNYSLLTDEDVTNYQDGTQLPVV